MVGHASDESESKADMSSSGSKDEASGNENSPKEKQQQQDGNGDEEEQQQQTPSAVGFWDPSLKAVRNEAFTKWTITTAFLMAFIIACLSLYWGVFTHVEDNLTSLHIMVADFDAQVAPYNQSGVTPMVGPTIQQLAAQQVQSPRPSLGYVNLGAAHFNYDPIQVRRAVYDFKAWGAIIINPNATALLYDAVQYGNTSYDPLGAGQLVYVQARDSTNWDTYIYPQISTLLTEATSMVGQQWTQMVMQNATSNQTLLQNLANVPQALSPAIGFSQYNLRPFYPATTTPTVSIGLIYLIIISFFSFSFYLPIHFKVRPLHHPPHPTTH